MPLFRMAARTAVVAGTATAVSGRVARRQQGRYAEQDQQAYDQQQQAAPPAPASPAPPAEDSLTAKLESLAQLHTQGILTDEEFSAAKAKALA
jgi:hypothetical protein